MKPSSPHLRPLRILPFISLVLIALGMVIYTFYGSNSSHQSIVVFAGAAAAPVYREAASIFESKYGIKVEINLGGSGSLLSSMEITRKGDIYIPGSPEYLALANEKNVVNLTEHPAKILAYLVPAIIVQKGNPKNITSIEDLAKPGIRVGIGDPKSVCVGLYAKEILERSGLWEAVSRNIVVYAASCEATAQLIYIGAVDAVIGWHVFYHWNPERADIVWIEPSIIPKIGYIAGAVTTYSKNKALAEKFLDFLASQDMRDVWAKYGYFSTLEEARVYAPNAVIEELG
ncbi:MAG: molybdate ABC transporter substrate-binding protein [Candidatus Nezhaarchaeales archaeon]